MSDVDCRGDRLRFPIVMLYGRAGNPNEMGDHITLRIKSTITLAATLIVLGTGANANADVTTEHFYFLGDASVFGQDNSQFKTIEASGWQSSRDTAAVGFSSTHPGASSTGYQLDVSDSGLPSARLRVDSAVIGNNKRDIAFITSFGSLRWVFETSEPTVLEVRGLYQWEGDEISRHEMSVTLISPTHPGFGLVSTRQSAEVNTSFVMPAGQWEFQIFQMLQSITFIDGPQIAARSSLDIEFRIIPAPTTLSPLIALGLIGARRRR